MTILEGVLHKQDLLWFGESSLRRRDLLFIYYLELLDVLIPAGMKACLHCQIQSLHAFEVSLPVRSYASSSTKRSNGDCLE